MSQTTVLNAAMRRLTERAAAIGATVEGESFESSVAALLFSGLPVDADRLSGMLDNRVDMELAAVAAGVEPGEVLKGALAEALLLGFYIAMEGPS